MYQVELGTEKYRLNQWIRKPDFLISELLKVFWLMFELSKIKHIEHLKTHNQFFATLYNLSKNLKLTTLPQLLYSFFKETPYISAFLNPLHHPYLKKEIANRRPFKLPLPTPRDINLNC